VNALRLLVTAALFACSLPALEVVTPAVPIAAGDLATWRILGAPKEWFDPDVAKSATLMIVGPDNRTWKRAAFAYRDYQPHPADTDPKARELDPAGEPELRARHTPRAPGTHAWSLVAPDGKVLAQGEIQVGAAKGPIGPLRICRANPRLLAFADDKPFIPIGPNIAWADGPDRLTRFESYFTKLAEAGGTHCRVWMASWCGQIESDAPDAWRLDHAWLMDQVLARARAHGLRVTLVLDNYYDLVNGKDCPYGMTTEERQENFLTPNLSLSYLRRMRYVLARWGADDTILAWELYNELDMAQPVREKCLPWARSALGWLRRADPDARLRTISWCGDDFAKVMSLPDLDLAQVHGYVLEWADPGGTKKPMTRDDVRMLLEPSEIVAAIGKPFCFGELGYQGERDANQGNDLDDEGLLLRHQAWAGLLLGGYGSGMNWWWDSYIDARKLWDQYRGLAAVAAKIDWSDSKLVPLTPNSVGEKALVLGWVSPRQGLVWPQPRADTWYARFIENRPRQGLPAPVLIGLQGFTAGAAFSVHWMDMVTGRELRAADATADAQGKLDLLVAPLVLDQVAWIEQKK
jgi:hypothetical protein